MRLIISSGPPEFRPSPPHGRRTYWKSMSIIMKTYCYPGAFCMEHRTNNLTTVSNKSDTLYDTWTDRTAHHRLPKLWLGNKGAFRALFALIFISEPENKQNKPPKNIRQFENEVSENRKKNIKPSHGKFLFDKKCRRFQLPRHVKTQQVSRALEQKNLCSKYHDIKTGIKSLSKWKLEMAVLPDWPIIGFLCAAV